MGTTASHWGNYGDVTLSSEWRSHNQYQVVLVSGEGGAEGIWDVTMAENGGVDSVEVR